jgi:hypothetical protein
MPTPTSREYTSDTSTNTPKNEIIWDVLPRGRSLLAMPFLSTAARRTTAPARSSLVCRHSTRCCARSGTVSSADCGMRRRRLQSTSHQHRARAHAHAHITSHDTPSCNAQNTRHKASAVRASSIESCTYNDNKHVMHTENTAQHALQTECSRRAAPTPGIATRACAASRRETARPYR